MRGIVGRVLDVCCFTCEVRDLLWRYSWLLVVVMVAAFIWFTVEISKPVEGTLQEDLVTGTVHAAPELAPEGPLLTYVALHAGRPSAEAPEDPVYDQLVEDDGSFALSADPLDGETFFLLARIETAREEFYCERIPLPRMRVDDDEWVVAATGEPLEPRQIVVDKSTRCTF
jgi:hypothetical protein